MFRFEELEIWRLAVNYGENCYDIASRFPVHEKYSLSDQLRRAAISISNNIAEGSVFAEKEFSKFLRISIGSALETVNIINFARDYNYINTEEKDNMYEQAEKLIRKIRSFINSL